MGRALTEQLQLVTNWNIFPLENAYSSKPKRYTKMGDFAEVAVQCRQCAQWAWQHSSPGTLLSSPGTLLSTQHCPWRAALAPQAPSVCSLPGQAMGNPGWGEPAPWLWGQGSTAPQCSTMRVSSAPETLSSGQIHQTEQDQKIKLD